MTDIIIFISLDWHLLNSYNDILKVADIIYLNYF